MTDRRYWLWLSLKFKPGSATCDNLLHYFGNDPKAIYEADEQAILKFRPNDKQLVSILSDKSFTRVNRILDFCERENVGLLTPDSKHYPSQLMRITGRPPVIYYKGRLPDFNAHPTIGVVGTREVTPYGSSSAYTIAHDLASAGAIVVSGLALGTDTASHRGALDASGHTVAFLGCGIDVVYPKENTKLMQEMITRGTVMTDYPPGSRPEGWHFPIRNRLISGIAHGILVVEAPDRSGALITASHALKQGKLLYAVPGKVGELASVGTNKLIRDGAKMVTNASDILSDFSELFGIDPQAYRMRPVQAPPKPAVTASPTKQPVRTARTEADNVAYYQRDAVRLKAAEPRPVIIHGAISEEDAARAYMSMETDIPAPPKPQNRYRQSSVIQLRYPKTNENGVYEVALNNETRQRYESIVASEGKRFFNANDRFVPTSDIRVTGSLKEIHKRMKEADDIENVRLDDRPDFSGLTEDEITVVKFLYEKGRSNSDTIMNATGMTLQNFLTAATMLEIKRMIVQLPGGYFELIKN